MSCEDSERATLRNTLEENIQYFNPWLAGVPPVPSLNGKTMKRLILLVGLVVSIVPAAASAADKRPMTVEDLFRFQRVSDPQISPDGKTVAYVVGTVDLSGNKTSSSIWLTPASRQGEPRPLTNTTKKDSHPRWSPDGRRILFESNRSGGGQ